jgi:hypothetical protein
MFRVIGGAVVYGLALYGAVKLFDRPKMEVVIQPGNKQDDGKRSAATGVPADQNDKPPSIDEAKAAATPSGSTGSI